VPAGWTELHRLYRAAAGIVGADGDPYVLLALRLGRGRPEDADGRAFLGSARAAARHGTLEEVLRDHGYRPVPGQPRVWRREPEAGT
jgi:hypothetical protein